MEYEEVKAKTGRKKIYKVLPEFEPHPNKNNVKNYRYRRDFIMRVLALLVQNEGNVYKTSEETGITRKLVSYWSKRYEKKMQAIDRYVNGGPQDEIAETKSPERTLADAEMETTRIEQDKNILALRGEVVNQLRELVPKCRNINTLARLFDVIDDATRDAGKVAPAPVQQNNFLTILSQGMEFLKQNQGEVPSELITPEDGTETDD